MEYHSDLQRVAQVNAALGLYEPEVGDVLEVKKNCQDWGRVWTDGVFVVVGKFQGQFSLIFLQRMTHSIMKAPQLSDESWLRTWSYMPCEDQREFKELTFVAKWIEQFPKPNI